MKYSVTREKTINANLQEVNKNIVNLNNWGSWSPWACLDPQTKVESKDDFMAWDSKFTGSGNMKRIAQNDNSINIDLQFIKPFKSNAKVTFKLEKLADKKTKVIWRMDSKLPFYLIFFKKMFQVMVGRDFERGLNRLKYLLIFKISPTAQRFTIVELPP